MSKQRYIRDSFWTDAYIEKLTPDEKLIFLYLLTNPLNNILGIYEIRSKRIAFETGYDIEVIETVLSRFVNDQKLLREGDWVVIVNHVKNQSLNPSIIEGCKRIFSELPDHIKQAVTGWVQAGLLNLTLLNLTLPNLTTSEEVVKKEEPKKHSKDVAEIIHAFTSVDVKNKTYYSNKSQRSAAEFLIENYGFEEVVKRISFLPKSNKMKYFPTITTPCQLRDKWVQLEDAAIRFKSQEKEVIW